ncbi:MAG TPA: carbohydrate-binding family 9-like protein [Armatimonadota bacterium]
MSLRSIYRTTLFVGAALTACLGLGVTSYAEDQSAPKPPASLPGKEFVIQAAYTNRPITVDGHLSESVWGLATPIQFCGIDDGKAPNSNTVARVLWDDKYLYVGYRAYDKDIWSYFTKRDSWCYWEDCLELFFKTDPAKEPYYNYEINALGTIYDAFIQKKNAGGEDNHRWNMWNTEGIQIGTFVKGTINDQRDVDEYWQREMAIPFSSMPTLKGQIPRPGDKWKILLGRYDYSVYLTSGVETSSSTPRPVDNFHDDSSWVTLEFVK